MQICQQKLKYEFKRSVCIGLVILLAVIGAGCASANKTTKTTTVVTSNDQQNNPSTQKSESYTNTATETTATTTTQNAEHQSILGATLHAVGWVLALPFRLVGGLIGWIF